MDYILYEYNDFLEFRRKLRLKHQYPPIVFSKGFNNDTEFELSMNVENRDTKCFISPDDTANLTDFLNNRKAYTNTLDAPTSLELRSHDFSDNTKWLLSAAGLSVFPFQPPVGSALKLKSVMLTFDTLAELPTNGNIKMSIWQSKVKLPDGSIMDAGVACPQFGIGLTGYGPAVEAPVIVDGNVQSGWTQSDFHSQAFTVYTYFSNFIPIHQVTEFSYDSIEDIAVQSKQTQAGSTKLEFDYKGKGINDIFLRSSMNERIEIYIDNDQQVSVPENSKIGAIATFTFDNYKEW